MKNEESSTLYRVHLRRKNVVQCCDEWEGNGRAFSMLPSMHRRALVLARDVIFKVVLSSSSIQTCINVQNGWSRWSTAFRRNGWS